MRDIWCCLQLTSQWFEFIHGALKPLSEATSPVHSSILMVQPILAVLLRKHLSLNEMEAIMEHKVVSDMKTAVTDKLKQHVQNDTQKKLYLLASILDPRSNLWNFYPQLIDHLHLRSLFVLLMRVFRRKNMNLKYLPHLWSTRSQLTFSSWVSLVKVILPVVLTEPTVLARFERNSMIARE